jgi:hypothetical protein
MRPTVPIARSHTLPSAYAIGVWLVATTITVFFALLLRDSAIINGDYLPRTNDSLYHARRILDAAVGDRGFYQFDERLHAPDGAWISWPWAYDYLLAKLTQVALLVAPTLDPAAFISYAPVAWILVNAALFMAATGAIGLSAESRLLAMLCFALSPLTQLLHAIGMIDHHYVEHTFVLATILLGLRWFQRLDSTPRAVALAATLGLAPAFHNGLFILQLLPLATLFALWLRGAPLPRPAVRAFVVTLIVTTQIILLPSEAYRRLMFEFGLLSWFHFYVAICTSAAAGFMAWLPFSRRNLILLGALCLVLALPLGAQVVAGAGWLSGSFSILDQIVEARSPYTLFTERLGPAETLRYYSWLLLAAPPLLAFYAYRAVREREPVRLYYAIAAVFGLALLLEQFRLHYFGFFALVTGGLLMLDDLRARLQWHRGAIFAAAFALVVLAYQPALRERLFIFHAPGSDPEYGYILALYAELEKQCAADPGVVLAKTDDGNGVLFHSDCSIIANNFILRPEDARHIDEVGRLMQLSPAEIRQQRPDVKYLLVRVRDYIETKDAAVVLDADSPIAMQLLTRAAPPPGFELLATVNWRMDDKGTTAIFARLYKISPDSAALAELK